MAPAPTPRRSTRLTPLVAIGGLLVVLGLCLVSFSLGYIFDPSTLADRSSLSACIFFLIFIALPMLGSGVASLVFARRRHQQEREQALQGAILEIAQRQNGVVTAADLALHHALSLLEAQEQLEQFAVRGLCRLEMTDEGEVYFVFSRPRLPDDEPEQRLDEPPAV